MWPPASSTRANTTSSSAPASSSSLQVGAAQGAPPAWEVGCRSSQAVSTETLRFESCSSPVGESPQEGKTVRGLWPWSLCHTGLQVPLALPGARPMWGHSPGGAPGVHPFPWGLSALGQELGVCPPSWTGSGHRASSSRTRQRSCLSPTWKSLSGEAAPAGLLISLCCSPTLPLIIA